MSGECLIDDCNRNSHARSMCHQHYNYWRKHGTPTYVAPSTADRFWAKVDKTDGCWNWTAYRRADGYGEFRLNERPALAHRVAYEFEVGQIPTGKYIDHACHNEACVNPKHLRLATHKQNQENRAGANKNSTSGVRGVSWFKTKGKWHGVVGHQGRNLSVGYFKTIEAAEAAVIAKRLELFTHHPAFISEGTK